VDNLIANKGKHSITLPDLAAGEYLLRPEIIALHEGNRASGAQFYMECVQIKVTSSGAKTLPAGVAIPGVYTATDPGVLFDIYSGFTSYPIPGPAVWDGASGSPAPAPAPVSSKAPVATSAAPAPVSSKAPVAQPPAPSTLVTLVRTTQVAGPTATAKPVAGAVEKWGRCGGIGYSGASTCAEGWKCKEQNAYYFQCVEA